MIKAMRYSTPQPARGPDQAQITDLFTRTLGGTAEPYLLPTSARQCLVVHQSEEIVGAITLSHYESLVALLAQLNIDPDAQAELSQLLGAVEGRVGLIDQVAVDPSHQGQGLGTTLIQSGLRWLQAAGVTQSVTFAQVHRDSCPLAGALEANGGRMVGEIANFWTTAYQAEDWQCQHCEADCHCQARLYLID
ncbi:MAG: GNAT family N-acetyltransferase [Candidatus Saccharimonadales bacterium]